MSLFRSIIFILFFVVFFYISHQLTRFADLSLWLNLGILVFLGLLFACVLTMPLLFWSERRLHHRAWHDTFFETAHFSLGYINFLLALVVIRDIAAFIIRFSYSPIVADGLYSADMAFFLLLLPFFFMIAGTVVILLGPRRKKVVLRFLTLPKALENFSILHITDLHIGHSLPVKFVEKLVKKSLEAAPVDMVVYTGDILDGLVSRHQKELELLKQIPSKYGSYYVPGNHEYYWNSKDTLEAFRKLGFHVLINQTETLNIGERGLQISGVPDPAARMFQQEMPDFEKLKATLPDEHTFKILLSHQPSLAPSAAAVGYDLQLSGHTHGGQFFPWNFLIGFFQRYAKGLYHVNGLKLYVNQGTGYWGPSIRLGTYCELSLIVLKRLK